MYRVYNGSSTVKFDGAEKKDYDALASVADEQYLYYLSSENDEDIYELVTRDKDGNVDYGPKKSDEKRVSQMRSRASAKVQKLCRWC